jgi:nucleoside-diphosphate-sugar epimerase
MDEDDGKGFTSDIDMGKAHVGRVVSNFINQAINNQDITIYGNGDQTRSFCYIDDLIEGLVNLIQSDYHLPINIGNPNELNVKELANIVIKLTNSKSKLIYKDLPSDDPTNRRPDIKKANNILNWSPISYAVNMI